MTPQIDAKGADFPGDPSPGPPFGLKDTARSSVLWTVGASHLAAWSMVVRVASKLTDLRRTDFLLKWMARSIPWSIGVQIEVKGCESIDKSRTYVYVSNHVNIFDLFALYYAIPQYTRALEHIDHFSWPFIGPLISAAGQIPIDPEDPKQVIKSLKAASKMLKRGESLTVLPEASRTLDGSVGDFFKGAFRLAIKEGVPVVPIAIRGGRYVSRRGDWRFRPGKEEVLIAAPISTDGLVAADAPELASICRKCIIDLLQGRIKPGESVSFKK